MPGATEMFGRLLDRCIDEIVYMSADARRFEPSRIVARSDVWDNNTFPLVAAATAGLWRERRARTGLRWMGALGTHRREWMLDSEPALAGILEPDEESPFYRGNHGRVFPGTQPLTAAQIQSLADDYVLAGCTAISLAVEANADGPGVRLRFDASRAYEGNDAAPAELIIELDGVTALIFDAAEREGLEMVLADGGLAVRWGKSGIARAASGTVWIEDSSWHLSRAGRAADKVTPTVPRPKLKGVPTQHLSGAAEAAGMALYQAMIAIRRVRYTARSPTVPVHEVSRALQGAGAAIVAAGARRGRSRENAFAELQRTWRDRGVEETGLREPRPLTDGPAHLRYVSYSAEHQQWGKIVPAGSAILAAVPADGADQPWQLAGGGLGEPADFTLTLGVLEGPGDVRAADGALSFGDSLIVRPR